MKNFEKTLDEAIAHIQYAFRKDVLCTVKVSRQGFERTPMDQQAFDAQGLRECVEEGQRQGGTVTITVHASNGFAKDMVTRRYLPHTFIKITNEKMLKDMSNPNPASSEAAEPPKMDATMAMFMMGITEKQLLSEQQRVEDLRKTVKHLEEKIQELKDKNNDLQLDNRFKDKEHQLALAGVEQNSKSGLAGVFEAAKTLPPDVLGILVTKLMGGGAPQLPMGSLPVAANLTPVQQEAIREINNILAQLSEEQLSKVYAVAHYAKQGNLNLDTVLAQVNNAAA
ncbi:hypothetical protein [Pontibacter russatus]|uniref:hypothetical protein n=1 Tax=Pontibacter russatus TaxID=2694929 RepID=UPI00137AEDBA|nr:hypothetical protein [Pontibacter russatus]